MKNKLMIMGIIILLIITSTITSFASTENTITLQVKDNKNEVKIGESFSVIFSAKCVNDITAVEGFSYKYDTEKLEVVSKSVAEGFTLVEEDGKTSLVYFGETFVKQSDIYTITFKVKDGVQSGSEVVIALDEAKLFDNASEFSVPEQSITINIVDEEKTPTTDKCEHVYGEYVGNNDGTHSTTCTKCNEKNTEKHTCGEYSSYDDYTHSTTCSKCNHIDLELHTYQVNQDEEKCSVCGKEKTQSVPKVEDEENENEDEDVDVEEEADEEDETITDKEIPKAGATTILTIGLLIIAVVSIIMYRKNKKYEDIK